MQKNKTYYYPLGDLHSKQEKDDFYSELNKIRNESVSSDCRYSGDYSVITYVDNEGNKTEYWRNDELGVPSMIVYDI